MREHPRIGDLVDHDWKFYQFVRDSKLPRGTFDSPWHERLGEAFVVLAVLVAIVAVVCRWDQ